LALEALYLRGWVGTACRHIPDGSPYDIFDFRFAGHARDNRWNRAGESTLYLARDHGVAVAEFGRHLAEERSPELGAQTVIRRIYDLRVRVDVLLDLRDAAVVAAMSGELGGSLEGAPHCFLDRELARDTAGYLRRSTAAQGLLVPSMAFLDDLRRWVLVLFLEKLPADPNAFLAVLGAETTFRVERQRDLSPGE
jgi:RES domain-containing protein